MPTLGYQSLSLIYTATLLFGLTACNEGVWNNPYPREDNDGNILYASFESRPKHLDPVRAYSSNEYAIIANIYEPPVQYHYLIHVIPRSIPAE